MSKEPTKKGIEMICGIGIDKIRKAYFEKKLNPLISKVQGEAEAEERTRITKEFFDKEVASKNTKRIEEFYTFARRRDDHESNR